MLTGGSPLTDEELRGTVPPALVAQRRAEGHVPVQCDLQQGDILLRDARLWHGGTTNRTNRPRFMLAVVITRDAAPDECPLEGRPGTKPRMSHYLAAFVGAFHERQVHLGRGWLKRVAS